MHKLKKMYLRSIDEEWEGGVEVLIAEPCSCSFKKVVNNGQKYLVRFQYFMSLRRFFRGKTAVHFGVPDNCWTFYDFDNEGLKTADDGLEVKSVNKDGVCIYWGGTEIKKGCMFKKVYHYYAENGFITVDGDTADSGRFLLGADKFNEHVAFLAKYDEPTFAEY
jgi:hypothetical protein